MPRAYDRHQLSVDRNPLHVLNPDIGKLPTLDPEVLFAAFLKSIKMLTGLDLTSAKSLVASIIDLIRESIQDVSELLSNIVHAITGKPGGSAELSTWAGGLLNGIQLVIDAVWHGWGFGPIGDLLDHTHVTATMQAINAQIAFLVSQISQIGQGGGSGVSAVEQFGTYPASTTSMGAKWDLAYTAGSSGNWGIASGTAKFATTVGLTGRTVKGLYLPTATNTDDQRVSAVFTSSPDVGGLLGNNLAHNEIRARCNGTLATGMTSWVYVRLTAKTYEIGYCTPADGVRVLKSGTLKFAPAADYSMTVKTPSGGSQSTIELWENSRIVDTAIETANRSARGANNRRVGFEALAQNNLVLPAPMAAFGFRDL